MRKMRRFAAIAAVAAMTACMTVPMMAVMPASAADITIENIGTEAHEFAVYQVFTGELSGEGESMKLSNLKWGSGVTAYDGGAVTEGAVVAEAVSNAMTADGVTASDVLGKLTLATTPTATKTSSGSSVTIDGLATGYYVVKDVTNLDGKDDANSAWIVQVAGSTKVSIKTDTPTIDKQVWDEAEDAETTGENWGESADHAINESFQFRLVATIPSGDGIKEFDTYKLVFTDTMSAGVTFEDIASVTVGGTPITSGYTASAVVDQTWTLTIDDVKSLVPTGKTWGTDEIEVVVTYNAHLNADCIKFSDSLENGDTTSVNNNMVYLEYSNNPDNTGTGATDGANDLGKTKEDYVWVYTYTVDNTKRANTQDGALLAGAKFQLLSGTTAIKFIDNGDGTYTVADQTATTGVTDTLVSNASGKFDIIGLDAGTYTLTETAPPEGYNTCEDQTVKIGATHAEQEDGTVDMALSADTTISNTIINKEGSTLPSTGGIGTTLFYVVGGTLVAGAGVTLIAKKRMKKED